MLEKAVTLGDRDSGRKNCIVNSMLDRMMILVAQDSFIIIYTLEIHSSPSANVQDGCPSISAKGVETDPESKLDALQTGLFYI